MSLAHFINKRIQSIVLVLLIATLGIASLLMLMGRLADPEAAPAVSHSRMEAQPAEESQVSTSSSDRSSSDETVAIVNEQVIDKQLWQRATRLDAVMSRLAFQPIPTAEETLDRLINEIVVLEGAPDTGAPDTGAVTTEAVDSRIFDLTAAWNITEDTLITALADGGLSRSDLADRVARLIQVEMALNQLAAQEGDLDAWLNQARTSAEIGLYRSLVTTTPVQPSQPETTVESAHVEPVEQPSQPAAEIEPVVFAPPANLPVSPYPQNAAPDFILPQLNNEPLILSDFRGKPTVINFWATWCPPCRRELPALQATFAAHRDELGFVAVDVKESAELVAPFVEQMGLTFPVVLDQDGAISDAAYQIRGLPTTLFLDANGVVAARHVGPLDEALLDSYLAPLLAPSPDNNLLGPTAPDTRQSGLTSPEAAQQSATAILSTDSTSTGQGSLSPAAGVASQDSFGSMTAGTGLALPASSFTVAPDFTLDSASGAPVSLQDYRGKSSVVLVFYRGHF